MTKVMRRACTEVDEILKFLPQEYVNKVPQKFRRMFYDARLDDYQVKIDPNKSIKEQNVVYETLVILTILKLNFWCETEEEKNRINQKLKENEKRAIEKYDISKLNARTTNEFLETFGSSHQQAISSSNNTNLPVKVEKKSWLFALWNKVKNIFKKK